MSSFLHRYFFCRTPPEKLRQIPRRLKAIVEVRTRNMDAHQSINIAIHECFEREGVGFAFPTRAVCLEQEPAAEPA
jgi:small-conductance mechanosensitive channel